LQQPERVAPPPRAPDNAGAAGGALADKEGLPPHSPALRGSMTQSFVEVETLTPFRTLIFAASAAALLAGCDPRTELEQEASNISVASLRAEGKGAVVAEMFFDNRECFGGNIVLGAADGTEIHDTITRRHWRAGAELQFTGSVVSAGRHYILRLDCQAGGADLQFAVYRRKPGFLVGPIYYPLGSFDVEPGEVVYIGSLHAVSGKQKWFTPLTPAAIGIEDRSGPVRELLRKVSPALAEAMVVRLAAQPAGLGAPGSEVPLPGPVSVPDEAATAQAAPVGAGSDGEQGALVAAPADPPPNPPAGQAKQCPDQLPSEPHHPWLLLDCE